MYVRTVACRRRPDEFRRLVSSQANSNATHTLASTCRRVKVVNLWKSVKIHARRPPPTLTSKTYSTKMPRYLPPSVFVAICIFSLSDAFVPANKITPAEPPLTCTLMARGIGSSRSSTTTAAASTTTALNAKKKNTAPAASSKIQVKMLKHVEGTGHVRIFSLLFCLCVTFFVFFSYHLLLPQCTFINISTLPHI